MKRPPHSLLLSTALLFAPALTGCGINQFPGTTSTSTPSPVAAVPAPVTPVASIAGHVFTGTSPIAGASLQLYAAGTSGYGSALSYPSGMSLLGANIVTTDVTGAFTLSGTYTCPSASTLVYLVATGGSSIPFQPANPNLALMSALGPCGNLPGAGPIAVNELTTVASIWALAPFTKSPANVGTSATNLTGLVNAFAAVNKLVNLQTATLPGPALPSGATLPVATINTLADILQTCIASTGGIAGDGSPCGTLFSLAKSPAGLAPTDTLTAALNIAQNPAQNVAALTLLASASSAYQPNLGATPPAAWTLAIRYTAANTLVAPTGIAADQAGSVWITNQGTHAVTRLDPSGAVLSGPTGYAAGQAGEGAIAIDASGDAWVAASTTSALLRITPSGSTSIVTGAGLSDTSAIAIDGQGQIWAAGSGNLLSGFTSSGFPLSPSGFSGGGLSSPEAIAIGH